MNELPPHWAAATRVTRSRESGYEINSCQQAIEKELSLLLGVLIPTAELEKLKAIVSIAADISQKVAQSPQSKSLRSDISASFIPGACF